MVADLHHVDLALQSHEVAAHGQGAAPLSGAGLGGQSLGAGLLGVVGLRDSGVQLVAARGAGALVLVEDLGRRAQGLLQSEGPVQRARPPQPVDLLHFLRYLDVPLLAELLLVYRCREQRRRQDGRLLGAGMQYGRQRLRQVRLDVIPGCRYLLFTQDELGLVHCVSSSLSNE